MAIFYGSFRLIIYALKIHEKKINVTTTVKVKFDF